MVVRSEWARRFLHRFHIVGHLPKKWSKTQQTANAGILFIESVINSHGSIYRPIHQETDVGIDGYIELVNAEKASGRLIAVQIKSGDSYLSESTHEFRISVDQRHLDYWESYMLPVILVCYAPTTQTAAWVSIRDYIKQEKYHGRFPMAQICIPLHRLFDKEALDKGITGLAHARADERILLRCADKCLSVNVQERREGFSILSAHPDSRDLKITAFFARQFLTDEDISIAKEALFTLGYAVGRRRWSWNPNNQEEADVIAYASDLCSDLAAAEIRRIVELVDGEHFSGPQGLGERCFDTLCCCFDKADSILYEIASDKRQPMERRANALYMLYECDDESLAEADVRLRDDPMMGDVYCWMSE
jgi:hypothetical protein